MTTLKIVAIITATSPTVTIIAAMQNNGITIGVGIGLFVVLALGFIAAAMFGYLIGVDAKPVIAKPRVTITPQMPETALKELRPIGGVWQ